MPASAPPTRPVRAALQVCDQILAAEPGDADALQSKVFCLIELNRALDALRVIESVPALAEDRRFERAYCLYTLNREAEAIALLAPGGVTPTDAKSLQLLAQIKYRLGEGGAAAALFLQAEAIGGSSSELSTNIVASLVSAGKGAEALEYASGLSEAMQDGDDEFVSASPAQFELCAREPAPQSPRPRARAREPAPESPRPRARVREPASERRREAAPRPCTPSAAPARACATGPEVPCLPAAQVLQPRLRRDLSGQVRRGQGAARRGAAALQGDPLARGVLGGGD